MKQPRKKQPNLTQQENAQQETGFDVEAVRRRAAEYAEDRNRDAHHNELEGITDPNVGWEQTDRSLKSAERRLLELPEPWLQAFIDDLINVAREVVRQKDKPTIRRVAEKLPREHGIPSIRPYHDDDTPRRNIVRKIRRYYDRPSATWKWFLIHNKIIDG